VSPPRRRRRGPAAGRPSPVSVMTISVMNASVLAPLRQRRATGGPAAAAAAAIAGPPPRGDREITGHC
jgi:hypothetical protein